MVSCDHNRAPRIWPLCPVEMFQLGGNASLRGRPGPRTFKSMRIFGFLVIALLVPGCFQDSTTNVDGTDSATETGSETTTDGGGTTTDSTTDGMTSTTDASTETSPTSGPNTDSSTGDPCPAGTENCGCDGDACDGALTCMDGTCVDCGNGTIEPPEQCDGSVENGACVVCRVECDPGFDSCDTDFKTGCETNVTNDAASCGGCGHGCLGAACGNSICEPILIEGSQSQPIGIVTNGTNLFWANTLTAGPNSGVIQMRSVDEGGPAAAAVATGQSNPERMGIGPEFVYWGNVMGSVGRVRLDGTGSELTVTGEDFASRAATANANFMFWTNADTVRMKPKQVGAMQTLGTAQSQPVDLAVDGDYVYWCNRTSAEINRVNWTQPGAAVELVAMASNRPVDLEVAGDQVYWVDEGTDTDWTDGSVGWAPKTGGAAETLASAQDRPRKIHVDPPIVYWINRGVGANEIGSLQRHDLDTAETTTYVGNLSRAMGLDGDAVALYYTQQLAGTISKVAK